VISTIRSLLHHPELLQDLLLLLQLGQVQRSKTMPPILLLTAAAVLVALDTPGQLPVLAGTDSYLLLHLLAVAVAVAVLLLHTHHHTLSN
jgi:hypothetical protein